MRPACGRRSAYMFLEIIKAILMGIVEGITEWLPISSTGHMILLEQVVKFNASEEFKIGRASCRERVSSPV